MGNIYEYGVRDAMIFTKAYEGYNTGFRWRGMTDITIDSEGGVPTHLWADDEMYETIRDVESLAGSIESITRPVEVYLIDGYYRHPCGILMGQQERSSFAIAYKTEQPDDDEGYLLHILYNLSMKPNDIQYSTLTESVDAVEFKWEFVSVGVASSDLEPTSEVVISSRDASPTLLNELEEMIYVDKALPDIPELIEIIKSHCEVITSDWYDITRDSDYKFTLIRSAESLGGTIEAYSFPDEFRQCDGKVSDMDGLIASQQKRKPFSLCYRTEKSNGGYLLHVLYNLTISPPEIEYETMSDTPNISLYKWEFLSTPVVAETDDNGSGRTSELIIDSDVMGEANMMIIENCLYGSESSEARLPMPNELAEMCEPYEAEENDEAPPVEYGISNAVLYVDGFGYAWNGMVSVTTSPQGGDVTDIWVT